MRPNSKLPSDTTAETDGGEVEPGEPWYRRAVFSEIFVRGFQDCDGDGVGDVVAQAVVSEIGADMARFPSADDLVSWAALCPGQDESAGKRRSRRTRKGPV